MTATMQSEYGPPNPPPLTNAQVQRRELSNSFHRAMKANDPASFARAVDDAAKALIRGLRPGSKYADGGEA